MIVVICVVPETNVIGLVGAIVAALAIVPAVCAVAIMPAVVVPFNVGPLLVNVMLVAPPPLCSAPLNLTAAL